MHSDCLENTEGQTVENRRFFKMDRMGATRHDGKAGHGGILPQALDPAPGAGSVTIPPKRQRECRDLGKVAAPHQPCMASTPASLAPSEAMSAIRAQP